MLPVYLALVACVEAWQGASFVPTNHRLSTASRRAVSKVAMAQTKTLMQSDTSFVIRRWKSEHEKSKEAWAIGDAWRPGTPNEFTEEPKDLVELHSNLLDYIEQAPLSEEQLVDAKLDRNTSLVGVMLKTLMTADSALAISSQEPPVLKELRKNVVKVMPMSEAVLGVPEEMGRLLSVICLAMDARKVMDLGSFTGYSSIACALAMRPGGKVVCCENNERYAGMAKQWFKKAGVTDRMEMFTTTAEVCMETQLEQDQAGSFDLIFVDADLENYDKYLEQAMKLVRVGGMVVLFDTMWAGDETLQYEPMPMMRNLNYQIAANPRYASTLVPLSYGATLIVKTMDIEDGKLEEAMQESPEATHQVLLERRRAVEAELAALIEEAASDLPPDPGPPSDGPPSEPEPEPEPEPVPAGNRPSFLEALEF